jgi:adenylate cyclase
MSAATARARSRVRFSLRWKITIPFMLLALILGLGATVVLNRLLNENDQVRFLRQLADSGQQAADAVVRAEMDLLEVERLVANTAGVTEAAGAGASEELRTLTLPLAVNSDVDFIAILNPQGTSLFSVRRPPGAQAGDYSVTRDEDFYTAWPFVERIQQGVEDPGIGDKHAGLHAIDWGGQATYVFLVGGPLRAPDASLMGVVLVGKYLDPLTASLSAEAGANISVYDPLDGRLLSSSLEPENPANLTLSTEHMDGAFGLLGDESPVRPIVVAGNPYQEALLPFVARGATPLGVMGVSLLWTPVQMSLQENVWMVIRLSALSLALIVLIGLIISSRITRPLVEIAEASAQVATGNLSTQVRYRGSDEIGVLAQSFNTMVEGLREGTVYRDLLGRTVTPEVVDELRRSLADTGDLVERQEAIATILCADLGGLAHLAEEVEPAQVMEVVNAIFSGLAPIISQHAGVVNRFDGDTLMAYFGILPRRVPPQVSALQAVHCAMDILEFIQAQNEAGLSPGLPEISVAIGVATGPVVAGGIGTKNRLHYAVIGDTVITAQRIQQATRETGGGALLISADTHRYLAGARSQFDFGRTGLAQLRGKKRQVSVYEVRRRSTRLVERPGAGRTG